MRVAIEDLWGAGCVLSLFEPADLWGNGERQVVLSDFSLKAAPGMISAPPILTEAKERALMIPRFRRDDAPHQVLLAWNGDLLRGSIESATKEGGSAMSPSPASLAMSVAIGPG